jgi:small-conductance mechanosensitive channel
MIDNLLPWPAFSGEFVIAIGLVLGYPLCVLMSLELARFCADSRPLAADILRRTAWLLLPSGAIWLVLRDLTALPPTAWPLRAAETAFAIIGLSQLLRIGQAALMAVIGDQTRAPKLLFDVLRIGLSLVWGAVVISRIWEIDLGQLFAAMGVGSIVLGFALQEFLGNLLSGLGLLSAQKFGIGDWLRVDGGPARVVEMDWRTVTLVRTNRERIVVANSTLAKGNLVIAARASDGSVARLELAFGLDVPPEQVRDAVLDAAAAMPAVAAAGGARCYVTGIDAGGGDTPGAIKYRVSMSIANPGLSGRTCDEFLSRFWYVAQRRGLRLAADATAGAEALPGAELRLRMLTQAGVFHGDSAALARLAQSSCFRRYRRGDILAAAHTVMPDALLVVTGALAMAIPNGESEIRIEVVGSGQLLVLRETLSGAPGPVRVVAEKDTDILAIPAETLQAVMEGSPAMARDIGALAEARRLAVQPSVRRLRAVV